MGTPPFPENGPGLKPTFTGVDLVLMGRETPPDQLLKHISGLGKEFDAAEKRSPADAPASSPELEALLTPEALFQWNYPLFKLTELTHGKPLAVLAKALIKAHGLLEQLAIDETKLDLYLTSLESLYNHCLYHNPVHAADVMHATSFLMRGGIADAITPEERLVTLLAAPSHDLGHPGVNNAFITVVKNPLAEHYSFKSILENHHATLAITLLQKEEMNVLSFMNAADQEKYREMLRSQVLYTDMSLHMGMMARLQERADAGTTMDLKDPEDRKFVLQVLLHTADLSNPCKEWNIHVQWTHAILAEFFSQGDLERSLAMDVTPMLDRNISCGRTQQKGFFVGFVRPLFVILQKALPEVAGKSATFVDELDKNVAKWNELGF
mmetsp:Transcript_69474/g.165671  ORF Transcript_69474/g.165671 Transcript_69474/m.165671 type:complete len:381 (+) Transcript_69474:99-1241(+)|eukprot:CAMPEP_0180209482 /NCGR_PEP_ID=MMETSP0987-20121128/11471_1 /TAXON_ID=697907 /ORGANISM="non described non described, Strain CCMP2293" /LENGTH=380 /DNA_ID=CAMNT_0022166047 /DNA_START=94 /DNA_END=1236 /DNA_ORIENTATION=+